MNEADITRRFLDNIQRNAPDIYPRIVDAMEARGLAIWETLTSVLQTAGNVAATVTGIRADRAQIDYVKEQIAQARAAREAAERAATQAATNVMAAPPGSIGATLAQVPTHVWLALGATTGVLTLILALSNRGGSRRRRR